MLLDAEKPFNISMWLKMVAFTPHLWPFGKNRENDFSDPWVNWGVPYVQTKLFRTELWDHQKSTGWLDVGFSQGPSTRSTASCWVSQTCRGA